MGALTGCAALLSRALGSVPAWLHLDLQLLLHLTVAASLPASCIITLPLLHCTGAAAGGHYTAMCRVPQAGGSQDDAWYSFNDENVSRVNPSQASKPTSCC